MFLKLVFDSACIIIRVKNTSISFGAAIFVMKRSCRHHVIRMCGISGSLSTRLHGLPSSHPVRLWLVT